MIATPRHLEAAWAIQSTLCDCGNLKMEQTALKALIDDLSQRAAALRRYL